LILQFGLALKGITFDEAIAREKLITGSVILFVTVMVLWFIFSFIRSVLFFGFLEYLLLFPVSFLAFCCLEYVSDRFILKKNTAVSQDTAHGDSLADGVFAGGILAGAALFITLNIAGSPGDAIALSLGFSCSAALVYVIVAEIRRRSTMEAVSRWLRGGPLALIAMGLLSLVFSSGALILYGVLRIH
jgi:Na+-translocating ferredoxin:NAD+ oxidoreductase RnfA subunit